MRRLYKFIPGDIVRSKTTGEKYLITSIKLTVCDETYNVFPLRDHKNTFPPEVWLTEKKSVGWIKDIELETRLYKDFYDDYFCHDGRCKPGKLLGCSDCWYRGKKTTDFLPGDIVYHKRRKQKFRVTTTSLILGLKDICYLEFDDCPSTRANFHTLAKIIEQYQLYKKEVLLEYVMDCKLSHGLAIKEGSSWNTYPLLTTTKEDKEINLYKKESALILPEHRKAICSELCLFTPGSEECYDCEV